MILKNLNRLNLAQPGNKQLPGEDKAAEQVWTYRGHIEGHVKVSTEHLKSLGLTRLSVLGLCYQSLCHTITKVFVILLPRFLFIFLL